MMNDYIPPQQYREVLLLVASCQPTAKAAITTVIQLQLFEYEYEESDQNYDPTAIRL